MAEKEISVTEMAERFDRIATATVFDTMDKMGMPNQVLDLNIRINPGDLIVGDSDSVLVVPKEVSVEVLIKAEEIWEREEGSRKDLAAGMPFDEVFKKWGRA